ncbi:MAG: DUF454 domain-containing protein, partial [Prevotellaceae bacterium]|nr:DUF454 domain-containing protein [Prevotellaceae bacterium]
YDFLQDKSIPMGVKIVSTSMLWATIIGSIIFVANGKLWLQILLFAIAVGVTVHILSYKTKKKG